MTNPFARMGVWRTMPLCHHYFSAHFDLQPIQVLAPDGASQELTMIWALGFLRDGDWAMLGVWPAPNAAPALLRGVFDELAARGVAHISFVLADTVAEMEAICPGAAVLPPFTRIQRHDHVSFASGDGLLGEEARRAVREAASVRGARAAIEHLLARPEAGRAGVLAADWPEVLAQFEPFFALRPERRALVRRGDEVLEHLGRTLARAVRRHGPFSDIDAATSFVAETLTRAESQLSSFVCSAIRMPARRSGVLAARANVAAPGH